MTEVGQDARRADAGHAGELTAGHHAHPLHPLSEPPMIGVPDLCQDGWSWAVCNGDQRGVRLRFGW